MPGERQVTSPDQDRSAGGRITQKATSLAAFGSHILMGFSDTYRTPGNVSGVAFSSDGGGRGS